MARLKYLTKFKNLIKIYPTILLVLIGFLTYGNSFQNQFVWDDPAFFSGNILVRNFDIQKIFTSNTVAGASISSDYYRPVTSVSFAIDYKIWGLNPFGYHLTNTVLHILTALLVYSLLGLLRFNNTLSFWISLIFLVHPVQVEAVTYLSSRGDILYSFLSILSLYLFTLTLYHKKINFEFKKNKLVIPTPLLLICSIILYALSIFSKEVSLAIWPIFIFILIFYKLQNNLTFSSLHQKYKNHIPTILVFFWISLMYMFLRVYILNFNNSLNFVGAQNAYTSDIFVRIFTFFKIIWLYLGLIFWPHPLYLERDTPIVTNFINPYVFASIGLIILLLTLAFYEYKKTKNMWIFLGLFWIFLHIIPVSGLIPMTYLYHENWLYMPLVGFVIILFSLFRLLLPKINFPKYKKQLSFFGSIIVFVLILITIKQNSTWKDPVTLFEHNLKYHQTARLYLNLGSAYMSLGDDNKAIDNLNKASKIADMYPQIHYNLAHIYLKQNKKSEAREEMIKTFQADQNFFYVYPLIINSFIETEEYSEALPFVERLTRVYPDDLTFTILYGKLLFESDKKNQAEIQFQKALEISKNRPDVQEKINRIRINQDPF